jgi:hypothetical protein
MAFRELIRVAVRLYLDMWRLRRSIWISCLARLNPETRTLLAVMNLLIWLVLSGVPAAILGGPVLLLFVVILVNLASSLSFLRDEKDVAEVRAQLLELDRQMRTDPRWEQSDER